MTKIHQVHSKSAGHFAKEFPCLSPYKIEGSFVLNFFHLFEISDIVIGIVKLYLHSHQSLLYCLWFLCLTHGFSLAAPSGTYSVTQPNFNSSYFFLI